MLNSFLAWSLCVIVLALASGITFLSVNLHAHSNILSIASLSLVLISCSNAYFLAAVRAHWPENTVVYSAIFAAILGLAGLLSCKTLYDEKHASEHPIN